VEQFRSKSEAMQYLEFGIERGQYQDCGNLSLTDQLDFRGRSFRPYCREKSLGVNDTYRAVTSTYCPEDCHFFVPKVVYQVEQEEAVRKQEREKKTRTFLKGIATTLAAPFRYFKTLPAVVQSLIIILLIMAVFPKFKATIIEILSALKK
jgi:hypothetical protein